MSVVGGTVAFIGSGYVVVELGGGKACRGCGWRYRCHTTTEPEAEWESSLGPSLAVDRRAAPASPRVRALNSKDIIVLALGLCFEQEVHQIIG